MTVTQQADEIEATDTTTATGPFRPVVFDLYRDIHKGIRAALFGVTASAGRVDPSDRGARAAVAAEVDGVVALLASHAEHEDAAIQPGLEVHLPDLADRVVTDHVTLEHRMDDLRALAAEAVAAPANDQRNRVHHLYLDLASFTAAYLAHQDLEERILMPALEAAIGLEAVIAIHESIIGNIPPAELADSLAIMLPAMNTDDRTELLGGMQAGAPPEVFTGVWGLATSVIPADELAVVAGRLHIA
jgi:hypothetical protein